MRLRLVITIFSALLCATCERCAPRLVAQGVSRLTIRNVGAIVEVINDDAECGFESELAQASAIVEGEAGQQGRVRWMVKDCVVDLSTNPLIKTGCSGASTTVSGKLTVTATRTVDGYLTGDPSEPVIPNGPDAVTIEVGPVEVERLLVVDSSSEPKMTMLKGALSFTAKPRLARSKSTGVCAIPTPNVRISNIVYDAGLVRVQADGRDFTVNIPTSDLSAVNGVHGGVENALWGTITVWSSAQEIPIHPDESALDPEHDAETFTDGFTCTDDLETPIRFDCDSDVRPRLAQGAAQLTVQQIGKLAKLLDDDARCGFSSAAVKYSPTIVGDVGAPGGSATWSVVEPCVIELPQKTELERDCNGKRSYGQGTVYLTGTKTIRGYVSGDPEEPAVPTSRFAVEVRVTAAFDDFSLWADPEDHILTVERGELTATIQPKLAVDTVTGACSIDTPVATFHDVTYTDAKLVLQTEGRAFGFTVDTASLEAQNGTRDGRTNYLAGSITMDGEVYDIPVDGEPVLDPYFEADTLDASYACEPHLSLPASEADCSMNRPLGEGAGRLLIMTVGAIAGRINADADCGFSNVRVLLRPERVEGVDGGPGLMQWQVDDCDVGATGSAGQTAYERDCLGRGKLISGAAVVDANRVVRGVRKEIELFNLIRIDSIAPASSESVDLRLQRVDLNDLFVRELDRGQQAPDKAIRFHSGQLSARVRPITGENQKKPGTYDVPTPIAHMTEVELHDADVTIVFQGKTFDVHIDAASVEAFNGSYAPAHAPGGFTNHITGWVQINGQQVHFPAASGLDPDFDQSTFDSRYACTDDLVSTIPSVTE